MNKPEQEAVIYALADTEIQTQVSQATAGLLATKSRLMAGGRICQTTNYDKAKTCCDKEGRPLHSSGGLDGIQQYYCKVADSGTWDTD